MNQATALNNTNNVHVLNRGTVHNHIMLFLSELSEKTQKEYLRNIEEFFQFIHNGKRIEELTKNEIENVLEDGKFTKMLNNHIISYKNHLLNKNTASTARAKIAALSSLYSFFEGNGYNVNHLIFKVKFKKITPKSYDGLSVEHAKILAEMALLERYDAKELNAVILLAMQTSIRISALLSLKWSDIHPDPNSNLYTVKLIDKRDEVVIRGFKKELYEKMIEFKSDSETVFSNLKVDKVCKSIKRIAAKMGIPDHIRIVTHSFRHVAADFEMKDTGNIQKVLQQGGWKKAQTVIDHYTDKSVVLSELAGIRMMEEVNEQVFDLVDKNELLAMLKEVNRNAYNQMALKLQGIVGV